jgi:hypothetical protein
MSASVQLHVPHHADAHFRSLGHHASASTGRLVLPSESDIPKSVIRKDLREQPVGEPLLCVDATEMAYLSAAHTVEECVQMLLSKEEICLGWTGRRQIMNGARLVGYIEIVDERT